MPNLKLIIISSCCFVLACVLWGFAIDRGGNALCTGLEVEVLGDGDLHFVTQKSISQYVSNHGHLITGDSIASIDTREIEVELMLIPYLQSAEVFKTIDRKVKVQVNQRKPVMRIVFKDGGSSYVDNQGQFLPLSKSFSYKCLPVTGLDTLIDRGVQTDVFSNPYLSDLWSMARYIQHDEFWSAQFIQLDHDPEYGIVLIPRVGNHQIIFGDTHNLEARLLGLNAFYEKGITQTNWNIYQSLDLRYDGQVVGIKR